MQRAYYKCSQQELYTICNLGWKNCSNNLSQFSSFKAKYNESFIQARLAEINAAMTLPDAQARSATHQTLHIQLTNLSLECLGAWQKLKRYIADAYPASLHKTKNDAAGQSYYTPASGHNWEAVQGLLTSGLTFITTYQSDLTANLNMPHTFLTHFNELRTSYNTLHQDFLKAEEAAILATQQKQIANNHIYSSLISMFLDAQEIFRKNQALRQCFIFNQALQLITHQTTTTTKETIADNKPIQPSIPLNPLTTPKSNHHIPFINPSQQSLAETLSTLNITLSP